jgi:phosphatidylethanolamine/phosphatidyl-N-methylethanolamine N-methyltransferase
MPLFERKREEDTVTGDAATRALSVAAVENAFVESVYDKLPRSTTSLRTHAPPGRIQAIERMNIQAGERCSKSGSGTGINLSLYPREAHGHGDRFLRLDAREGARARGAQGRRPVRLLQMDAADLKFADDAFDIVYAPYLISVVPDPVKVAQEMRRVCRPGGRIIFLNHFLSPNAILSRVERLISPPPFTSASSRTSTCPRSSRRRSLAPVSIEKVNWPKIWSLVTCVK